MRTYFSILILFLFISSCSNKNDTETTTKAKSNKSENIVQLTAAQMQNAGIKTGKAEQRNVSEILKVNGYIDVPPQNIVSISVPMGVI
jgi:cobalt-zinc-cadmium efflux system membrane fusion protein